MRNKIKELKDKISLCLLLWKPLRVTDVLTTNDGITMRDYTVRLFGIAVWSRWQQWPTEKDKAIGFTPVGDSLTYVEDE